MYINLQISKIIFNFTVDDNLNSLNLDWLFFSSDLKYIS